MEQRTIADLFLPKSLLTWLRGEHKPMRYRRDRTHLPATQWLRQAICRFLVR